MPVFNFIAARMRKKLDKKVSEVHKRNVINFYGSWSVFYVYASSGQCDKFSFHAMPFLLFHR